MEKKRRRDDANADESSADNYHEPSNAPESGTSSKRQEVDTEVEVVLVEPFYSGSHKQLVDLLATELLAAKSVKHQLCTLPGRKWHWRLMASSLYFSSTIVRSDALRVLFVTSMVNLAELLGLRPDLNRPDVKKIYYFHENQLNYPFQVAGDGDCSKDNGARRKVAAEDFQIGWAQILSCLAADEVVFNSDFNRTSFLSKVESFLRKIPEQAMRPSNVAATLEAKSSVLFFPVTISMNQRATLITEEEQHRAPVDKPPQLLTILWNHRWEYDKNPADFFQTLFELEANHVKFQLIVLGEQYNESPEIFVTAKERLEAAENVVIIHWGYAPTRKRYFELLKLADVVVSTSNHEFYGVAVIEAVLCGCYPLVPNRLVYPEFFASTNTFNTQRQLYKKLKYLCGNPFVARKFTCEYGPSFRRFTWDTLCTDYEQLLLLDNKGIQN